MRALEKLNPMPRICDPPGAGGDVRRRIQGPSGAALSRAQHTHTHSTITLRGTGSNLNTLVCVDGLDLASHRSPSRS